MKTKIILHIIIILMVFSACSSKEDAPEEESPTIVNQNTLSLNDKQIKSAGIKIDTLQRKKIGSELILNGSIEVPPKGVSKVSAPGGGYVRSANFIPGDYVKKGQTLVVIENPDLIQIQEDYLLAKSNYSYATKNAERQATLNKSKASSDKSKEMAQNEARNQNILINTLAQKLRVYGINPNRVSNSNIQKKVTVRAPISGYITAVNVNIGQYVTPTEILFEVINNSDVHLVLQAFEKDLAHLKVGQNVLTYTNQNPEKQYWAKIMLIGQDISANRSVEVHCHFENYDPNLIPGTYMNGVVEGNETIGWSIPENGVVTWEDQQYIFEAKSPHTFEMLPIHVGNTAEGFTQISSNAPNFGTQKYVTSGAYSLLMALKNSEEE